MDMHIIRPNSTSELVMGEVFFFPQKVVMKIITTTSMYLLSLVRTLSTIPLLLTVHFAAAF